MHITALRPSRSVSLLAGMAGLAMAALTWVTPGAAPAHAAAPTAVPAARADLPPGVVRLNDGEDCPPGTLCLYRDYRNQGPAYGIAEGYFVDLRRLPMDDSSAANNVSSWVNNTGLPALLIDEDNGGRARPLAPGQSLQEPSETNDTVDVVAWLL